jgi:hypothetical protein
MLRYAICPDYGGHDLNAKMDPHFKRLILAQMEANAKPEDVFDPTTASIAFEDITVPCFLVLVNKGRMGDTFSRTFRAMDLRLRNQTSLSVVVQELGRLAGWKPNECCVPSLPSWVIAELQTKYGGTDDHTPKCLPTVATSGYMTNPNLPVAIVSNKLYNESIAPAVVNGSVAEVVVRIAEFVRYKKMESEQIEPFGRDVDIDPGAVAKLIKLVDKTGKGKYVVLCGIGAVPVSRCIGRYCKKIFEGVPFGS